MTSDQNENLKRWMAKRRSALVLEILRGDASVAEAARKHERTVAEIQEWRYNVERPHQALGYRSPRHVAQPHTTTAALVYYRHHGSVYC